MRQEAENCVYLGSNKSEYEIRIRESDESGGIHIYMLCSGDLEELEDSELPNPRPLSDPSERI